jgi:hypothetical protein
MAPPISIHTFVALGPNVIISRIKHAGVRLIMQTRHVHQAIGSAKYEFKDIFVL